MNKGTKKIYDSAIKMWGIDAQQQMMIEESSELIKAICKFKRNGSRTNMLAVIEEMADVEIMLEQMKIIFDTEHLFDSIKQDKIDRLELRLESEGA